jgi:hypothetical protein
MIALWELPQGLLLGLLAADLEPLMRCSDGRWRSVERFFPPEGLSHTNVKRLEAEHLIERSSGLAILTDQGKTLLRNSQWSAEFPKVPAVSNEPHLSLQ